MSVRSGVTAAILGLLASISMIFGLGVSVLRTGQVDPLDWLWPSLAVVAVMAGWLGRARMAGTGVAFSAIAFALIIPPLVFAGVSASRFPAVPALAFVVAVAILCLVAVRWRGAMLPLLGAIAIAALIPTALRIIGASGREGGPAVAVLSGVPLIGTDVAQAKESADAAGRMRSMEDVAARSPFWTALAARRDLTPIDVLSAETLGKSAALLVVQPRLLQPIELVALDSWLRGGGHALILADPLLLARDARPLGHPRRAPLTSLLDPLLKHWGLELEPARIVPDQSSVERRFLADGTLFNLAAASRFVLVAGGGADCALTERGLIATCRLGKGSATLIADADFIDDGLWTLDPDEPDQARWWTSDAIPWIESHLSDEARPRDSRISWLLEEKSVVFGTAAALLALWLVAGVAHLCRAFPMPAQTER